MNCAGRSHRAVAGQVQAACCGLYALRPSPTACDVGGMVGLAGTLDAPAFLAQTPDGLEGIVRALQLPGGAHEASPWLAMLSVLKSQSCGW